MSLPFLKKSDVCDGYGNGNMTCELYINCWLQDKETGYAENTDLATCQKSL